MGRNINDILRTLPAARRRKIEKEAHLLIQEHLTLQELRQSKSLTQARLAKAMKVRQKQVSEIESRSDMFVSTVRRQVEAMGGKLDLIVRLPDREPVVLRGLGELTG